MSDSNEQETRHGHGSGSRTCYPFSYSMTLVCDISGQLFEFHKQFRSPTQLRADDLVYINGLEEVRVASVVWYLDEPGHAFVQLEDRRCAGDPSEWRSILDDMDYSVPDVNG